MTRFVQEAQYIYKISICVRNNNVVRDVIKFQIIIFEVFMKN